VDTESNELLAIGQDFHLGFSFFVFWIAAKEQIWRRKFFVVREQATKRLSGSLFFGFGGT
jgi:hypothetical protein